MSALGHKRTYAQYNRHVYFTPESRHLAALFHIFVDGPIDRLQSVEGTLFDASLVAGAQGHVVILCGPVDVAQQPVGLGTHNP
jgi:hypothetical protein